LAATVEAVEALEALVIPVGLRPAFGGSEGPALLSRSFVLPRDDLLADDAAVAAKLGQAVAPGKNPGEPGY
jgi:hypothetical protein